MASSDDVEELVADTLAGLHGVEREQQVHSHEPGAEADEHEQTDLDPGDRHADGTSRVLVATDREDPVADSGLHQHIGGDRCEQQPPDHGDAERDPEDVDRGGECPLRGVEAGHIGDRRGGYLTGDQLCDGKVDAGEHQEAGQSDEEGWNLRLHHHVAVEETHTQREYQGQCGTEPDIEVKVVGDHRRHQR